MKRTSINRFIDLFQEVDLCQANNYFQFLAGFNNIQL